MDELFRARLKDLVTIHGAMFKKLLWEQPLTRLELADLFDDIANKYRAISKVLRKSADDYPEEDHHS